MSSNLRDLVGGRVRFHRTENSMSRRVLAEQTEISERYLAQLEAGKANISIMLIDRIASSLGISLTEVMKPRGLPAINKALDEYLCLMDNKSQLKHWEFFRLISTTLSSPNNLPAREFRILISKKAAGYFSSGPLNFVMNVLKAVGLKAHAAAAHSTHATHIRHSR